MKLSRRHLFLFWFLFPLSFVTPWRNPPQRFNTRVGGSAETTTMEPLHHPSPSLHPLVYYYYSQPSPPPQTGGWGWVKQRPVNYSAVSLLGLLALMGMIQHVMTELDTSTSKPPMQSGMNQFESSGMSIINRPLRPPPPRPITPIRPTQRPQKPTARPSVTRPPPVFQPGA